MEDEALNQLRLEFQSDLMRQEHRSLWVFLNAWNYAREPASDPRRSAARQALLSWWLFRPITTVAIGGAGITAFVGLWLAWQANSLLTEQNKLLQTQNALAQSTRQSSLVVELTSIFETLDRERARFDTAIQRMQRDGLWKDNELRKLRPSGMTTGRILALSRSLKPYQILDNAGIPLPYPLSPERAQLLSALANANIDLAYILLEGDFRFADFRGVNLSNSDFNYADFRGCDFTEALLTGVTLENAYLPEPEKFKGATLKYVKLEDAIVFASDWLDRLVSLANPPRHFERAAWMLKEVPFDPDSRPFISEPGMEYVLDEKGIERVVFTKSVSGISYSLTGQLAYRIVETRVPEPAEAPPAPAPP